MSEFKNGISVSKSYGQILTEYHEQTLNQLKGSLKMKDVQPLYEYFKLLRKMRPNEQRLSFIDVL